MTQVTEQRRGTEVPPEYVAQLDAMFASAGRVGRGVVRESVARPVVVTQVAVKTVRRIQGGVR